MAPSPPTTYRENMRVHEGPLMSAHRVRRQLSAYVQLCAVCSMWPDLPLASARSHIIRWSRVLLGPTQDAAGFY